jgi:hypothetical protein
MHGSNINTELWKRSKRNMHRNNVKHTELKRKNMTHAYNNINHH